MARRSLLMVPLAGVLLFHGAWSSAEGPPAGQTTGAAGASGFKVVIWYDRARPFETFRYRAYDLGRGEYTQAVDDWMELIRRDYPGYSVSLREVPVTDGDPAEKVAAAVEDERLALAKSIMRKYSASVPQRPLMYGSGYSGLSWSPQTTAPGRNSSPFRNGISTTFAPLGAAHTVPSPTYPFPTPMPYPRPHP